MARLIEAWTAPASELRLEDFVSDAPAPRPAPNSSRETAAQSDLIEGVTLTPLVLNSDSRGWLCEALTTRDGAIEPIVHVYQVAAAPGSIRAWVYHRHQHDRLALIDGDFEVVLYDIRPDSRAINRLNVIRAGKENPCLLRIPPLVVHGIRNRSSEWAYFINMPTKVYRHDAPDKARLPVDDRRIPYTFR